MRARSIATLTVAAALTAASSASAAVWHASPTGTGNDPCKPSDPCSLGYAANVAPPGTEVLVAQGTYAAVTYSVDEGVYIHGSGAKPYPLVQGSDNQPFFRLSKGDHLRYMRVHQKSDYARAIDADEATIENVSVEGSGNPAPDLEPAVLLGGGSALRDSVVWSTAENAVGVRQWKGYAELRNVTVWTRGYGSIAVSADAGCFGTCQSQVYMDMRNVIARGGDGGYDVSVKDEGATAQVAARNSSYRAGATQTGAGAVLSDIGGNQKAVEPALVNPAIGDFHELPGSPTRDAGEFGGPVGLTDFDDLGRALGQAPDIGAFELQNPTVAPGAPTAVKAHAATLHGMVTPNGKVTAARFQLGATTAYGRSTAVMQVGSGTSPIPVAAIPKLVAGRTYHYRLVALNADGASYGADRTFTTPAVPFAGVQIKKQKVKVTAGAAPVTLSCSADTKGSCSGTLALAKLGTTKLSLLPGQTAVVKVKLTKQARALLAQAKKLKRLATAKTKDGEGHAKTTSGPVTLKS